MIEIIFIENDYRESITINLEYLICFRIEEVYNQGRTLFIELENQETIEIQNSLIANTNIDQLKRKIQSWFNWESTEPDNND
jgi:hypothetical protein